MPKPKKMGKLKGETWYIYKNDIIVWLKTVLVISGT